MNVRDFLRAVRNKLQDAWYRRGYYLPKFVYRPIEPPAFDVVPDGFTVHHIGNTGVLAVDNFCTDEECEYLIERAAERLAASTVVDESDDSLVESAYRISTDASVYSLRNRDPVAYRFVVRAAMLLGVPTTHAENFPVTYYSSGGYFHEHMDAFDSFHGDRHYTVLVYLNDVGENAGGETMFPELRLTAQPRKRRAIVWRNYNNDGTVNQLSKHAALKVAEGAEKWIVQLGFRRYPMYRAGKREPEAELRPLRDGDKVPAGILARGRD